MAQPNRQNKPDIENSEQGVLNKSFDREYEVLAVEALVFNPDTNTLDRMTQPGSSSSSSTSYESRNDTTTDTNLVYLGKAIPGTATSAASWQIKRYNKSAGHMSFADDVTTFTKEWDSRTSYSY